EKWRLGPQAGKGVGRVGVVGAGGLTKPHAFVVAQEGREGLAAELQAFVRERLEAYKSPREVIFLDALPRTHLGKVDRARLRRPEHSSHASSPLALPAWPVDSRSRV